MAVRQSAPPGGRSISLKTTSTMPSSMSSLLRTWLYSDIASMPSLAPRLRMLSDSMPSRSARPMAARRTRSRVRVRRRFVDRLAGVAIAVHLALLSTIHRKPLQTYAVCARLPSSSLRCKHQAARQGHKEVGTMISTDSPKRLARLSGVLYLLVGICGGFAQGYTEPKMYVAGNAAATAGDVLPNSGLVRLGVVADPF